MSMSKEEMLERMANGAKVRHSSFTGSQSISQVSSSKFEIGEGHTIDSHNLHANLDNDDYDDGWEIF